MSNIELDGMILLILPSTIYLKFFSFNYIDNCLDSKCSVLIEIWYKIIFLPVRDETRGTTLVDLYKIEGSGLGLILAGKLNGSIDSCQLDLKNVDLG